MEKKNDWNLELSEYIKQGEPSKVEKQKHGKQLLDYKK